MLSDRHLCVFYQTLDGGTPVEDFISSLDEETQDKFIFKKELLESFGARLRLPHTDSIGDGIFELRFKGKEGQIRVLFFFFHKRQIILVHGFIKKTRKTPNRDIKIAKRRMREYLERHK